MTHNRDVLLEGRESACEVEWEITQQQTHTHTHAHHPGYPSRSFPPDAEAIGTISCPWSPSLRTAPSFSGHISQSGAAQKPPWCNILPHLNRQNITAVSTHKQTKLLGVTHQQETGHDNPSSSPHLIAFH